jgi:calcineurin-like phosphoesterase
MCGPVASVLGVDKALVLRRFLTHMPVKFEVASGPSVVQGVLIDVDPDSGQAQAMRRVQEAYEG